MKDPKATGEYKVTLQLHNSIAECFAHFDTFYGWSTFVEPIAWRSIHSEIVDAKPIQFLKY